MHASSLMQAYAFPSMSLPAISGLVSAFFGSPSAIASSASGVGQNVGVAVKVDSETEGFSSVLDFSEVGLDSLSVPSLGVAVLGERLPFSLPVMLECGALIYPFEFKSVLRYHWRSKVGRGAHMDASLFDEAVTTISALTTLSLGAFSHALGGTVVQSSPKPGGALVSKSPSSNLLRRGFLLQSVPFHLGSCVSPIAEKGVNFRLHGLI
jgi:hypothetical protein